MRPSLQGQVSVRNLTLTGLAGQTATWVDPKGRAKLLVEQHTRVLQRAAAFDAIDDFRRLTEAGSSSDSCMANADG